MIHKTLFVGDFMMASPLCLPPDMDILVAISALLKNNLTGALVVNESGQLVGILTERDCIQVAVHAGYFNDLAGSVADYMKTDLITVTSKDNLMDVAENFINTSNQRFPVVDNGILVGLIRRRDVLRAVSQ